MRASPRWVIAAIGAVVLTTALAEPAEARRGFRFRFGGLGGGGSTSYEEKIEKVSDLPNSGTYFREGKYYDLGNFYVERSGIREYSPEPIFVLYAGERYVKLDDAQLAIIKADIGMDPTSDFRARYKADLPAKPKSRAEVERLPGESMEAFRARLRGMASRGNVADPASARGGSTGAKMVAGWAIALFFPLLVAIVVLYRGARRIVRSRAAGALDMLVERRGLPESRSFDDRVAARLRELQATHPASEPAAAPALSPAAPRTFGRKVA